MLQNYQRIMVAVDGSAESELAFKKAVNIATRNNAELLIVHVIDPRSFQSISSFDNMLAEQATTMAKQTLEEYRQQAIDYGFKNAKTLIEYGTPKVVLSKQLPQEHKFDLIILGATGLNAVERLFIGSVSDYVIRNASCDVLVVRTDLDNKLPEKKDPS